MDVIPVVVLVVIVVVVLMLMSQHKGSSGPSARSLLVDEDLMRPDHLFGLMLCVLCVLPCFDADGWVTGRTSGPKETTCATYSQTFSFGARGNS